MDSPENTALFGTFVWRGAFGRPAKYTGAGGKTKIAERDGYRFLLQILKDFPDFNPSLAETYVKEKLAQVCAGKPGFRVHNVVISGYDRARTEKTVVYQAALEYREKGVLRQKRYCLRYASLLPDDSGAALALNCPNCGASLSDAGETVCTYCGSPLVQVMKHTWRFTEVFEK